MNKELIRQMCKEGSFLAIIAIPFIDSRTLSSIRKECTLKTKVLVVRRTFLQHVLADKKDIKSILKSATNESFHIAIVKSDTLYNLCTDVSLFVSKEAKALMLFDHFGNSINVDNIKLFSGINKDNSSLLVSNIMLQPIVSVIFLLETLAKSNTVSI